MFILYKVVFLTPKLVTEYKNLRLGKSHESTEQSFQQAILF
jgi:hypothetical protein